MPFHFESFKGLEGSVNVPSLGAVAAVLRQWQLRREESGQRAGQYSLRAAFTYVNEALLDDATFTKEASLLLRRHPQTKREQRVRMTLTNARIENSMFMADVTETKGVEES